MARNYDLVACNKTAYGFFDEQVLETYKSLEEVDYITCRFPNQEYFLNLLELDGTISEKNLLSLRYKKDGQYRYLHPIFNVFELTEIANCLEEVRTFQDGHPVAYKVASRHHPFFQEKWQEFQNYIQQDADEFFHTIYEDNAPKRLENLVNQCQLKSEQMIESLEDEYSLNDSKEAVKLEFSRYKIFRGYLYYTNRYQKNNPDLKEPDILSEKNQEASYFSELGNEYLTDKEVAEMVESGDDVHVSWRNR